MSDDAAQRGPRIAVLRCEDAEKWDDKDGLMEDLLARPGDAPWALYRVTRGDLPDDAGDYDAYVITGSHYSCTDPDLDWVPELEQLIRECTRRGTPVIGLCFGHQVMAQALGGKVGKNPDGRFVIGLEEVELLPEFAELTDGQAPPDRLRLLQSHSDAVLELPAGARLLGRSASASCEVFRLGSALGVQGHPELLTHELDERILSYVEADGRVSPQEAAAARRSMQAPPDSDYLLGVLRRFIAESR